MKSQRSTKLLLKIVQRFGLNLKWISDQSFELLVPNWLELQENRGGKNQAKNNQNRQRTKKREERDKKREERDVSVSSDSLVQEPDQQAEDLFGTSPPLVEKPAKPKKAPKKPRVSEFPLREILDLYPKNNHGQSIPSGMKFLAKDLKTQEDFEACKLAAQKFADFNEDKDPEYVLSFARWAPDWREHAKLEKPKPFNPAEYMATIPTYNPGEIEIDLEAM
jgi:hypothetical protein